MENTTYELIIIGAGPAGLTAGIYSGRYKLKTLILGKLVGGMAGEAYEICNFPSHEKISGMELMQKMFQQVTNLGVDIKQEVVTNISGNNKEGFKILTNQKEYLAKKVLIATGTERRKLGLEKEKELTGKGISYCATCDAGFYKDKIAGVVGGGNSALTAALLLSKFANKVYLIYRKNEFKKAEPAWIEEIKKNEKIEVILNSKVKEILGDEKLEGVIIEIAKEGDKKNEKINLNGLFVEIGSIPEKELAEKIGVDIDEKGYIKVNKNQETSIKGIFAAGDSTNNPLKQAITASSEGAIAAYSIYEKISKNE